MISGEEPVDDCVSDSPHSDGEGRIKYGAKPLLFAFDKDDAIISKNGSDVQILIFSQGDWTWNEAEVPSWLKVEKTGVESNVSRTLLLSAEENNTGELRKATITVTRTGGTYKSDARKITVTQSRN